MALSGFKLHKFCFPKDSNHTETPKWCYRYYAVNPKMKDAIQAWITQMDFSNFWYSSMSPTDL